MDNTRTENPEVEQTGIEIVQGTETSETSVVSEETLSQEELDDLMNEVEEIVNPSINDELDPEFLDDAEGLDDLDNSNEPNEESQDVDAGNSSDETYNDDDLITVLDEENADENEEENEDNDNDDEQWDDVDNETQPQESDRETLPQNSEALLMDVTTSRFSSAEWYSKIQQMNITLAGVGGIGSYVALLLGRMKPASITIYDPDRVEAVNMSGQLYGRSHIGMYKSYAMGAIMQDFADYFATTALTERFEDQPVHNIAICGFDNMTARKDFFRKWTETVFALDEDKRNECLFIDGRLAAEEFQVFCIAGDQPYIMQKYNKDWLFSDTQAETTICSYKQTAYCANMIASVMVNVLVNFAANLSNPLIPREIPFMTRYDATTMNFKTEL